MNPYLPSGCGLPGTFRKRPRGCGWRQCGLRQVRVCASDVPPTPHPVVSESLKEAGGCILAPSGPEGRCTSASPTLPLGSLRSCATLGLKLPFLSMVGHWDWHNMGSWTTQLTSLRLSHILKNWQHLFLKRVSVLFFHPINTRIRGKSSCTNSATNWFSNPGHTTFPLGTSVFSSNF